MPHETQMLSYLNDRRAVKGEQGRPARSFAF